MSKKNNNSEKKEKDVYIIITNSLQNDFLEADYLDELYATEDNSKLNYDICQEIWIECSKELLSEKETETPKDKSFYEKFMEKVKECAEKYALEEHGLEKYEDSYLKFIEKYNHRVHIDHGQSNKLWKDGDLEQFIIDLMEKSYKANITEETNKVKTTEEFNKVKTTEETNEVYYLIHLRDWHDPTDTIQKVELKHYGNHCIKGTHGAKFIKPLDNYIKDKNYDFFNTIINANSLSAFAETNFEDVLEQIMATEDSSRAEVKIGIFGTITNIKILLLTFELNVVKKFENVYVCGDLCAGFNQKGHEDGINYMKDNLNIKILDQTKFREEFNFPKTNS